MSDIFEWRRGLSDRIASGELLPDLDEKERAEAAKRLGPGSYVAPARSYGELEARVPDEQRAYLIRAVRAEPGHALVEGFRMEAGEVVYPEDAEMVLHPHEAVALAVDLLATVGRIEAGEEPAGAE